MSSIGNETQPAAGIYPPASTGPNVSPPPPVGYPTKDDQTYPTQNQPPVETKPEGHNGFWKGCVACCNCCTAILNCCTAVISCSCSAS